MVSSNEKIIFSDSNAKIALAQKMLDESGIQAFVVNKMDSAFGVVFGDIELHVSKDDVGKAREILEKAEIL